MTSEEFKSFKRGIALDAVKFKRGKMDKDEFYKSLVITLGKEIFEETVRILDNDVPE
jgi:hypothetical protein